MILSPSSINLFIEEPALWVVRYLYKVRGETGIFAVRGKIAEEVINYRVEHGEPPTLEQFLHKAVETVLFDEVEVSQEDYQSFYNWGMQSDNHMWKYSIYSMQDRVEGELFGMKVAGYTDYLTEDGYIDLKTCNKIPHLLTRGARKGMLPSFKGANIRQQLIYKLLTNKDCTLLFVQEDGQHLKYMVSDQDMEEQLPLIEAAIKNIKKLLEKPLEDVILETFPKKTSTGKSMNSFFWDDISRAKAREIYKN